MRNLQNLSKIGSLFHIIAITFLAGRSIGTIVQMVRSTSMIIIIWGRPIPRFLAELEVPLIIKG
ncbi:Uncharacterised protein [Mycobacterium tuberculosis]|nr:Uncharacterised protein [Mycobacterium tuberculosis]